MPILLSAGGLTLLIAFIFSRVLAKAGLLPDHPTDRSSHDTVTPRSGGVAIIAAAVAGLLVIAFAAHDDEMRVFFFQFAGIAAFAAFIGLVDDFFNVSAIWKLAGQLAVAGVFVAVLGPVSNVPLPFIGEHQLGMTGVFLTMFWIVAFMNAFNFMDGANGLAAGGGIIAISTLGAVTGLTNDPASAIAAILVATALFGFFPSNYPHPKLFMGDSGSQGVGFLIAGLAVVSVDQVGPSALFVPVAFMPFLFDVAWTLVSRLVRRKNVLKAHREHLYQILMRLGMSHIRVSAIYLTLTALCSAGAVMMLRLAPDRQWLAPLGMIIVFIAAATLITRLGAKRGMFDEPLTFKQADDFAVAGHLEAEGDLQATPS